MKAHHEVVLAMTLVAVAKLHAVRLELLYEQTDAHISPPGKCIYRVRMVHDNYAVTTVLFASARGCPDGEGRRDSPIAGRLAAVLSGVHLEGRRGTNLNFHRKSDVR